MQHYRSSAPEPASAATCPTAPGTAGHRGLSGGLQIDLEGVGKADVHIKGRRIVHGGGHRAQVDAAGNLIRDSAGTDFSGCDGDDRRGGFRMDILPTQQDRSGNRAEGGELICSDMK